MVLDHIGIVVKNLEKGIEEWEKLFGYRQKTRPIKNTRQKVRVVFLEKSDSILIKLVEPLDETSSVYLFSIRGGGLHHLCFLTSILEDGITHLKCNGARLIVPPQPGEAFDNEKIAFFLTSHNLNIELIDTVKKVI